MVKKNAHSKPIVGRVQPAATDNQEPVSGSGSLGFERLVFFSDAVFAIAITLLALEIRLPEVGNKMDNAGLQAALLGNWHQYLAYAISFLVIGSFWSAHHRKFRLIRRFDRWLILMNLLFLMSIAFIPFSSSVISEYSNRTGTIFYALTMALVGICLAAEWGYAAHHHRLIDSSLDARQVRRQLIAPLLTSAIFLLSIGLAFLHEDLAKFSWLLILPVSIYANRE
jgi:uncharacterized membrane protein